MLISHKIEILANDQTHVVEIKSIHGITFEFIGTWMLMGLLWSRKTGFKVQD